jgi:hypothetical protein
MISLKPKGYAVGFQWYIGQKNPLKEEELYNCEIVEIQADGDELEHIKQYITGIPFRKAARVQRWFGDMANFIAHNL